MRRCNLLARSFPVALLLLGIGVPAAAQTPEELRRAAAVHAEGVRLFQAGDHAAAAAAFEQAEQLAPNPVNLYNRARCAQELGDTDAAISWLDRYLASPSLLADDRAEAEARRAAIEASRNAAAPLLSPPPDEPVEDGLTPGPAADVATPQSEQPVPLRPRTRRLAGPWAVLGVGLGTLAVGSGLYVAAFVTSAPPEQGFDDVGDYDRWHDNAAYPLAVAGDVVTALGAATAVAGLIWLLVARSRRAQPAPATAGAAGSLHF